MKRALFFAVTLLGAVSLSACTEWRGNPPEVSEIILDKAVDTVERFKNTKDFSHFTKEIPKARGVIILPTVVKGGFFFGGEGGNGVLLTRNDQGDWSYPAFYSLASASFGLQIGIQDTEIIMVLRSQNAVNAVLKHQAKLGADAGVTIGIIGAGAEAATTTNVGADIIAFANSKVGAYAGMTFEGAAIIRRSDLNEYFYQKDATPEAIVIDRKYRNARADKLRTVLKNF
ncbi:MAG: lipid-binding SYLF domain-containing protein [Rhodospirillaceae bacterium]|jgi:lipid-binding SYLF domain-containing protein